MTKLAKQSRRWPSFMHQTTTAAAQRLFGSTLKRRSTPTSIVNSRERTIFMSMHSLAKIEHVSIRWSWNTEGNFFAPSILVLGGPLTAES